MKRPEFEICNPTCSGANPQISGSGFRLTWATTPKSPKQFTDVVYSSMLKEWEQEQAGLYCLAASTRRGLHGVCVGAAETRSTGRYAFSQWEIAMHAVQLVSELGLPFEISRTLILLVGIKARSFCYST